MNKGIPNITSSWFPFLAPCTMSVIITPQPIAFRNDCKYPLSILACIIFVVSNTLSLVKSRDTK